MARRRPGFIANSYPTVGRYVVKPNVRVRSALSLLEDRRFFRPEGVLARPRAFFTKPRLVISPAKRPMRNGTHSMLPVTVGFDVPKRVGICVRRKQRREVIHAKRLTQRGAGGAKSRNWWSDVTC